MAVVATLPGGREQVGSGYLVDAKTVITAEHCTRDVTDQRVAATSLRVVRASDRDTREQDQTAHVKMTDVVSDVKLDVAVLGVPNPPWKDDLPSVVFCRADRQYGDTSLEQCSAIGYPLFQRASGGLRGHARLNGVIYETDEAETGHFLMRDVLARPGPDSTGSTPTQSGADLTAPPSPWDGLSGALVFYNSQALGVVVEHHPRQGDNAIRLIGFERIASQSPGLSERLRLPSAPDLPLARMELGAANLAELATEIDLTRKVAQLSHPLPLRILFATSSDVGTYNLANERGSVIEAIHRAFLHSNLASKLHLELLEWRGGLTVCAIDSSGGRGEESSLRNVAELDELVAGVDIAIVVVWHDLGDRLPPPYEDQNQLSRQVSLIRDRNVDRPQTGPRLILLRRSDISFLGNDADASEVRRRYDRVEAYFRRLAQDQYTSYLSGSFSTLLERNVRVAVAGLLDRAVQAGPAPTGEVLVPQRENPYRGLNAYGEEHTASFYGRGDEVNQLTARFADLLHSTGLLVVVGASGAGKSSVIRAGLIPRLRLEGVPGSSQWQFRSLIFSQSSGAPANVIIDQLAEGLAEFDDLEDRRGLLDDGTDHLSRVVEPLLQGRPPEARVLLFIDQFEEILSPAYAQERPQCVQVLERVLNTPRLVLVVAVRSDFFHRCLSDDVPQRLRETFRESTYWLLPPTRHAMLTMITRPALFAGAVFEDIYLPLDILEETRAAPGALPLVSCALEMLYERCPNGVLTRAEYEQFNGVFGVIESLGSRALTEMRPRLGEDALRQGLHRIFRSVVSVDDNGTATKKATRREVFADSAPTLRLVDKLIKSRLLQSYSEPSSGDGQLGVVSLAHEAVLSNWRELTKWIDSAREALVLRHKAERAFAEWKNLHQAAGSEKARLKIDRELLWSQTRLDELTDAFHLLGVQETEWPEGFSAFIRPEFDRLWEELTADIKHHRRAEIGERMAVLGDRRRGVGLRPDGVPEIEWCAVPGGRVPLNDREDHVLQERDVAPFFVSKYPVTLQQFNAFAADKTYFEHRWWTDLPVRPEEHPPYPQTPGILNHPAQTVSWYRALAFCAWLSDKLGGPVRLPTEWEWVQAAVAGRSEYRYPWGRDWRPNLANHKGALYRLMSVGLYPDGASPTGVMDLSGNSYEWCLNEFDDPSNLDRGSTGPHTTRGGAFFTMPPEIEPRDQLSIYHRLRDNPNGIGDRGQRLAVGIRLVCDDLPPQALPPLPLSER